MLASERQRCIVEGLRARGFAKTAELQQAFSVSAMTIRRDLVELEHRGLLRRVRGGAAALEARDIGDSLRERVNRLEKEATERRAATLVSSGKAVFIDAGTTCIEVAHHLLQRQLKSLYRVTSSVKVLAELAVSYGIKITQLGGATYAQSFRVRKLATLRVDWAFLRACGFDCELGLTNHFEVAIKRAAVRSARRGVFLLDSSKWGRTTLAQIAPVSEPHTLITSSRLSVAARQRLQAGGGR